MTPVTAYLASPKAMDDLRDLNARFIENFLTNDVASHDALLHAEFIGVRSDGTRIGRASYLEQWATGFDPDIIVYWDVRDEFITLIGNVALVRSTNKHVFRHDGRDETGMTTYTDTYLYEAGAWKCIQAQITPIAPGKEPADETIASVYIKGVRQ
ncbi:nuclear transport factor 2 family protein [Mesorhizobium sp. IMUNJ 23232]|uniref:nuclear transport factor 2 family protein n=1 Tax=Mesorhizobium sp. IMUNJ 23232 TaxID=3376064 RepID=UPI00379B79B0